MDNKDWNDAIKEWLEEHDDDDVGMPDGRYVIPESVEKILETDTPEEIEREKVREFSERFGWIWDLSEALYWYVRSWFTTDVVLGLFRASYGLIMAGLLLGIIYSFYFATKNGLPVRTLPTIDELMRPASEPTEGSPKPQDGKQ